MKASRAEKAERKNRTSWKYLGREIVKYKAIYGLMLIPLIYFFIFKYLPLWNAQIAFKDFIPEMGVWGSPWTGLENLFSFFNSIYFWQLLRNTIGLSMGKLILGLPFAVILAILLNESTMMKFKGFVQTVTYLPHFLSWVIMYGVLLLLLHPDDGFINLVIKAAGGRPINFLQTPQWYPVVVILSDIWKETGWGAIIYLAAMAGIDPGLYEAAQMEGANRLQRIRYITLPGITEVILIITLLRLGSILDAGFHQIFMTYSVPVLSSGDIIDTWVYRYGVLDMQFSLASAVGIFKGGIGLGLVLAFNKLAKRYSAGGLL